MNDMVAVLLGGHRGSDGVYAFSRDILFYPAGAWVVDALPKERLSKIVYLCEKGAPELRGTEHMESDKAPLAALLDLAKTVKGEHILVIAAPAPQLKTEMYETLLAPVHSASAATQIVAQDMQGSEYPLQTVLFRTEELIAALEKGETEDFKELLRAMSVRRSSVVSHAMYETDNGLGLFGARTELAHRVTMKHVENGVMIFALDSSYIAPDAVIGAGTQILPGTLIRRGCKIGAGCIIGPNAVLENAEIGDGTTVNTSQVYDSKIGAESTVGPFAYVRPGCVVGDHTRIGDFVELKNSQIGNDTKVSHLTYIGDAEVGERVNFGCGTVVVNYDGYIKSKTVIGDDCFIGCNTNLVAPVKLGDRVFTAAGTTVTSDVADGALTVGRARQKDIEGWNDKRREAHEKK